MSIEISNQEAQATMTEMLVGCFINKVAYHITGWDFRLIGETGPEYNIYAAEVEVPNILQWWNSVKATPVDLGDTNEPEDTIVAMNIFTVVNKWPICRVSIDDQSNLYLEFGNGCVLKILAIVELIDWTWQIGTDANKDIMTCDSGTLYAG